MAENTKRTTDQKIELFRRFFTGREDVYGTYDPKTGQARQVKAPVTWEVIFAHLKGLRPYGVYLLVKDHIRSMAVDFDNDNPFKAVEFVNAARRYGISAYVERSKSKGYHLWMFFENPQTPAFKGRLIAQHILNEIEAPHTEIFPKQDALDGKTPYGNFINAPLFGALVPQGRTVFLDESGSLQPYPNPWEFLKNIKPVPESLLDEIIAMNQLLDGASRGTVSGSASTPADPDARLLAEACSIARTYGLPACAQKILQQGVHANQRAVCFRLAVQLRKTGLPRDIATAALISWSAKNQPMQDRRRITESEIQEQIKSAYEKAYNGCGCEDVAIAPYCDASCPIRIKTNQSSRAPITNV